MNTIDVVLQIIYFVCLMTIAYLSSYFTKVDYVAVVSLLDGAFLGIVAMAALHYRIMRIEKRKLQST